MRASSIPESPDPKINDWFHDCSTCIESDDPAIERHCDYDYMIDGYLDHVVNVASWDESLRTGRLIESLVQGLRNLKSLESIELYWDKWCILPEGLAHLLCEPAQRYRSPFYRWPHTWQRTIEQECQRSINVTHYRIVVSALIQAEISIRMFTVAGYLSSTHLDNNYPPSVTVLGNKSSPFLALESLRFPLSIGTPVVVPLNSLFGLSRLFNSADRLKRLELFLPATTARSQNIPRFFNLEIIFPKSKTWNYLESLKFEGLKATASEFVQLFLHRLPNLKHLEIGGTALTHGNWKGIIESLRQSQHLSSFYLAPRCLFGPQVTFFWSRFRQIDREIALYVANGGRHPLLPKGHPDSAAQLYIQELEPILHEYLAKTGKSITY